MSAAMCIAFYGVRFEVGEDEIEQLEARSESRMVAARNGGLKTFWANFGEREERYLLFVGAQVGLLGPENDLDVCLRRAGLHATMDSTDSKLKAAGFEEEAALYLQWRTDLD